MNRQLLPPIVLCAVLVAACAPVGSGASDAGLTDGEDAGAAAACVAVAEGAWGGGAMTNDDCLGHPMTMTVSFDDCAITFSDWSMAMSTPEGATINADAVSFTGADWSDCTGTVAEDGSIEGNCSDGCTFTLEQQ